MNIDFPIAALAAVRGVLVSAETGKAEPGWQSLLAATLLLHEKDARLFNELLLEGVRRECAPSAPSRLSGLFCFESEADALTAAKLWGGSFRPEFLTEVEIEPGATTVRVDSNWYSFAPRDAQGVFPSASRADAAWMNRYWAGEPCPERPPLWEVVVNGRLRILNDELRQRAADSVVRHFPRSLWLIEIWRAAAAAGSDMGDIAAHLQRSESRFRLHWYVNMRDANDTDVLSRLKILNPHVQPPGEVFGEFPDLSPFGFDRPEAEMPMLQMFGREATSAEPSEDAAEG